MKLFNIPQRCGLGRECLLKTIAVVVGAALALVWAMPLTATVNSGEIVATSVAASVGSTIDPVNGVSVTFTWTTTHPSSSIVIIEIPTTTTAATTSQPGKWRTAPLPPATGWWSIIFPRRPAPGRIMWCRSSKMVFGQVIPAQPRAPVPPRPSRAAAALTRRSQSQHTMRVARRSDPVAGWPQIGLSRRRDPQSCLQRPVCCIAATTSERIGRGRG